MNIRLNSLALAALVGLSSATFAAADVTSTTRQQRMDDALQNYRGTGGTASRSSTGRSASMNGANDSRPGPAARSEETVKRVSRKTGHAVADGARKTGHVVANGARTGGHYVAEAARKTGSAIRRTGDKMGGSSTTPANGDDSHVGK